ncbi:MAG: VanZ family protein [Candidatus Omnitrophica bacterium]|nr:VanZ family protein [Candidatus Omnitrophota bacterium]
MKIPSFFSQLFKTIDNRSLILPVSLSRFTLSIAVFIIVSASFMRQIVDWVRNNLLDEKGVGVVIICLAMAIVLALLISLSKKKLSFLRLASILIVIAAGFLVMARLELAVEKVHILEYAFLGWLTLSDTTRTHSKSEGTCIAVIFCAVVGIIDELFQAVLPYRFYDARDIVFNLIGAIEGILLYSIYS